MEVELFDLVEDPCQALGEDDFAIDEIDPIFVDFSFVGLDLIGDELTEHLDDVAVERHGLFGGAETFALGIRELVLGDTNEAVPVDALVEVELKIVVVFEEIGHD